MFKNKGLYEWKLIENDKVVAEGSQWNTSTDQMILALGGWQGPYVFIPPGGNQQHYRSIHLSGDTAPVGDLRQRYAPYQRINTLTNGRVGYLEPTLDKIVNTAVAQYLFAPPISPRTIKIIGSSHNVTEAHPYEYASFIELSTPITQQTNQYLFVKYTVFYSFVAGGYNSPDNRYIQRRVTQNLLYKSNWAFSGAGVQGLCPFNPPTDKDKVMRHIWRLANSSAIEWSGPCYGQKWVDNYTTTQLVGPLGIFVFGLPVREADPYDMAMTIGYSIPSDFGPAISRVFTHPASRIAQVFSDPAYPPNSQGTVALSGTPTNKHPIIGRVRITKTGDASDIVDETFLPAAVNTGTNEITIAQSFALDDIVRFTNSGGALPTGISVGVDYYVIQAGTTIQLSTSLGGLSITISDQGTGTHTIIRQNTGRFSLELEPWAYQYRTWNGYPLSQLSMGVDVDNKMQAHSLSDQGYGVNGARAEDEVWPFRYDNMIEDQIQVGDFIYTIQKSRSTQLQNVCRWRFWTIETSEALCKFGTTGTKAYRMIKVGTDVYIATSDGIYLYDTTTPTVAPSLLTVTGIIDNNVYDLAYDPISTYMWSGHTTGLSKIDLGLLTATQYLTGGGGKLVGMTAGMVHIATGQLEAYNGRVIRDGAYYNGGAHDQWFTDVMKAWVLQDEANDGNSIGWCSFGGTSLARNGCLRKGTNQIVDLTATNYNVYDVTVLGLNSGTVVTTYTGNFGLGNLRYYVSIAQISDSVFMFNFQNDGGSIYGCTYVIGSTPVVVYNSYYVAWSPESFFLGNAYTGATGASHVITHMLHNTIDLGNGILVAINFFNAIQYNSALGIVTPFGWDGANWIKDNILDRPIPKTGATALLQGVSVAFNNATGKPWDQQFVSGDRFTWVHGPNKIKDNLQTISVAAKNYHVPVDVADAIAFAVPASVPFVCHVTETTDPDFRATDPDAMVVKVMEGATAYTEYTPTIAGTWSVFSQPNDTITCGLNIATGTPVKLYHTETNYSVFMFPTPLVDGGIYYAINVDVTHIKLAATYADAIANTPIDFLNGGYAFGPVWRIAVLTPGTGKYSFGSNGVFIFAAADATKNLTLTYTYSLFA